jgi:hypothetical protein
MKAAKFLAGILFYISRLASWLFLLTAGYALVVVVLMKTTNASWVPMSVSDMDRFTIYFPFTTVPFLLGEYTLSFLIFNLAIVIFYGVFLWLLSNVFNAFRQPRLFTTKGVTQLSRFYIINILVPVMFIILSLTLNHDWADIIQITFLHLIIAVFAFFMAAIFREGVILQEEQDLTF